MNTDAPSAAPLRVRISAPNSPNPLGRWRGKPARLWTATPAEVEVVDEPKGDGQISHKSFVRIQADPLIKVEHVGGMSADTAAAAEVSMLKAELAKADEKIAALTDQIGVEGEKLAEERRIASERADDLATRLERAENEIGNLRAKLSEAQAPKRKAS